MTRRFPSLAAVVFAASSASLAGTIYTGTDEATQTHVKAFDTPAIGTLASYFPYTGFSGGVRVAAGDVTGDGLADVVTGAGPGGGPHVKVFSGNSASEVRSFFAYDAGFNGGVFVAAGDVTGDGRADLVTGTGTTASHVKVFNGLSNAEVRSFFAFPGFQGGVRVAAGDVNGDGRADLVAGTGVGGGGVRVFDAITNDTLRDFAPFPGFAGGVYVAAGDVNGDGRADVVVGTDAGPTGLVRVFDGVTNDIIQTFEPYAGFTGGVRVATGDLNGDGKAEIITGTGIGASHVKAFNGVTPDLIHSFIAYQGFNGGVFVAGATPVPEPGVASLTLISGAAFLARRVRSRGLC